MCRALESFGCTIKRILNDLEARGIRKLKERYVSSTDPLLETARKLGEARSIRLV
jgi:hypothetical protein